MNQKRLALIFKRLGFNKHSADVYTTIFKHGPALATKVISLVKGHRPAIYRSLSELLEAELIIREKHGKRFFWSALDSKRIEELFKSEIQDVHESLPQLKTDTLIVNDSIRILKGKDGIRTVFDDVVNHMEKGGTFYRFTSERDLDTVNSYLSTDYRKIRDAKHLERKVISNPISGKRKTKRLERFIKFIPQESSLFSQNIIQLMYNGKIAFIDLNKEEVLIVDNKELAEFQTVIFKQLYVKL